MPIFNIRNIIKSMLLNISCFSIFIYLTWFVYSPTSKYLVISLGVFSTFYFLFVIASFLTYLNENYTNKNKNLFVKEYSLRNSNINNNIVLIHFQQYIINKIWYKKKIIKPIISGHIIKLILAIFVTIGYLSFLLPEILDQIQDRSLFSKIITIIIATILYISFLFIINKTTYLIFFIFQPFVYKKKIITKDNYVLYQTYNLINLYFKNNQIHHDYKPAFSTDWMEDNEKRYFIKGKEIKVDYQYIENKSNDEIKSYLMRMNNIKHF